MWSTQNERRGQSLAELRGQALSSFQCNLDPLEYSGELSRTSKLNEDSAAFPASFRRE